MTTFNEFSRLAQVAIRNPLSSFINDQKLCDEWQSLRFHSKPDLEKSINEFIEFKKLLDNTEIEIIELPRSDNLTIDSIYTRDSILISPKGLILCNMGRASRTPEAKNNSEYLKSLGHEVAGEILAPGTLEGGDFIWLNNSQCAVGLGPRTNQEGISQLAEILGKDIELHVVPLPSPSHPDDVLHLMSIISPLDKDLAVIYRPFMPASFIEWLERLGMKFVEVREEEYLLMACNVLAISPRSVIMLENLPKVKKDLQEAGCTVQTYKGIEISRKGEGGPTCLTRPLKRK
jgi:N-dimethylarginine dimethylaminohydrolase